MTSDTEAPLVKAMVDALDMLRSNGAVTINDLLVKNHSRRTAFRSINALVAMRLVVENSGRYLSPEDSKVRVYGSPEELQAHLNHAQKLLPAFKYLAGTLTELDFDVLTLKPKPPSYFKYVEMHLRSGYPKLFNEYESIQNLKTEIPQIEQELLGKIREGLPKLDEMHLENTTKAIHDGLRLTLTGREPLKIVEEGKKLTLGPYQIANITAKEKSTIKSAIAKAGASPRNRELCKKLLESERKYQEGMAKIEAQITNQIITKIDNSEPPRGRCDLCPNIEIRKPNPTQNSPKTVPKRTHKSPTSSHQR